MHFFKVFLRAVLTKKCCCPSCCSIKVLYSTLGPAFSLPCWVRGLNFCGPLFLPSLPPFIHFSESFESKERLSEIEIACSHLDNWSLPSFSLESCASVILSLSLFHPRTFSYFQLFQRHIATSNVSQRNLYYSLWWRFHQVSTSSLTSSLHCSPLLRDLVLHPVVLTRRPFRIIRECQ